MCSTIKIVTITANTFCCLQCHYRLINKIKFYKYLTLFAGYKTVEYIILYSMLKYVLHCLFADTYT